MFRYSGTSRSWCAGGVHLGPLVPQPQDVPDRILAGARRDAPRHRSQLACGAARCSPPGTSSPPPAIAGSRAPRLSIQIIALQVATVAVDGIHPANMDGVPGLGAGEVPPGGRTVYEFDALPAGLHLYHCHVRPLAEHIAKGLYGAFIVDPKDGREDADELVMVMNGFDTNFDRANEFYAANTIGFAYMDEPIVTRRPARPRLPGERARVRPHQLLPPAREPLQLLPDRHRRSPPSSPTR